MDFQNTDNEYLPECYGKEKFGVSITPEKLIYVLGVIMAFRSIEGLLFNDSYIESIAYQTVIIAAILAVVVISCFNPVNKIQFNNEGVAFLAKHKKESKFFKWEDIKGVAISPAFHQKRKAKRYVYFAINSEEINRIIRKDTDEDNIIFARYRPKMIHCVCKYYEGEIRELDKMKSWERYVNRLR